MIFVDGGILEKPQIPANTILLKTNGKEAGAKNPENKRRKQTSTNKTLEKQIAVLLAETIKEMDKKHDQMIKMIDDIIADECGVKMMPPVYEGDDFWNVLPEGDGYVPPKTVSADEPPVYEGDDICIVEPPVDNGDDVYDTITPTQAEDINGKNEAPNVSQSSFRIVKEDDDGEGYVDVDVPPGKGDDFDDVPPGKGDDYDDAPPIDDGDDYADVEPPGNNGNDFDDVLPVDYGDGYVDVVPPIDEGDDYVEPPGKADDMDDVPPGKGDDKDDTPPVDGDDFDENHMDIDPEDDKPPDREKKNTGKFIYENPEKYSNMKEFNKCSQDDRGNTWEDLANVYQQRAESSGNILVAPINSQDAAMGIIIHDHNLNDEQKWNQNKFKKKRNLKGKKFLYKNKTKFRWKLKKKKNKKIKKIFDEKIQFFISTVQIRGNIKEVDINIDVNKNYLWIQNRSKIKQNAKNQNYFVDYDMNRRSIDDIIRNRILKQELWIINTKKKKKMFPSLGEEHPKLWC